MPKSTFPPAADPDANRNSQSYKDPGMNWISFQSAPGPYFSLHSFSVFFVCTFPLLFFFSFLFCYLPHSEAFDLFFSFTASSVFSGGLFISPSVLGIFSRLFIGPLALGIIGRLLLYPVRFCRVSALQLNQYGKGHRQSKQAHNSEKLAAKEQAD